MAEQAAEHGPQGAFDEWMGGVRRLAPGDGRVGEGGRALPRLPDEGPLTPPRSVADSQREPFFVWLLSCPLSPLDLRSIPSMLIGSAPVWHGTPEEFDREVPEARGFRIELRAWRASRDRRIAWEGFFVTCLQRMGWIVIREPINGRVIELKRPMWLKNEDKA
jgi:hypothetical protein